MIKVQSILTSSGEERWFDLNENGASIIPIMKFIKYKGIRESP
ncbi:hypothetical protein AAHB94_23960 [Bacillus toyonensis]